MGLGPPFCKDCNILTNKSESMVWACNECGGYHNLGNLWEYDEKTQDYIISKSTFYSNNKKYSDCSIMHVEFPVQHTARRLFPAGDPNEIYRAWLESTVGKQGKDWNWDIDPDNYLNLIICFRSAEMGVLFELSW